MRRILLLSAALLAGSFSFAQVAYTTDFSGLTIGNVGTDLTGITPGQGMFLTTATNGVAPTTTTNSNNNNFQIVDAGATQGLALQLTGPNGDKGNKIITQAGLPEFWTARTPGNNIIEIEYDFFTGPATTSLNNMRFVVFDPTGTKILCGLSMVMSTKVLSGVAYYDATASPGGIVGNYLFFLGVGNTNLVLPDNTWVRIGCSYNYTTGQVRWKGANFNGQVPGAAMLNNPQAANIMATTGGATNALASSAMYDGLVIRASATDTLLGVEGHSAIASVSVYPNPASNVLNIANAESLRNIAIVDLNGRTVKSNSYNGVSDATIDISNLSAGMYMINISTDSGTQTQKIIKN